MKQELFEFKSIIYVIRIGQNKEENFNIISDSSKMDIWFHIEDMPSCHVILTNTEKINNIPRQVIKRCAYLCKINSKAKVKHKCNVMYTSLENVTMTKVIGQVNVEQYKVISV